MIFTGVFIGIPHGESRDIHIIFHWYTSWIVKGYSLEFSLVYLMESQEICTLVFIGIPHGESRDIYVSFHWYTSWIVKECSQEFSWVYRMESQGIFTGVFICISHGESMDNQGRLQRTINRQKDSRDQTNHGTMIMVKLQCLQDLAIRMNLSIDSCY